MGRLGGAGTWLLSLALGVSLSLAGDTSGLVERAAARLTADVEEKWGAHLYDIRVVPFKSKVPGTMKWTAGAVERGGKRLKLTRLSTEILAEFPAGWVLRLEVDGTPDNDALARRVLETLRTSDPGDSDCIWPLFRSVMAAGGMNADSAERSIRANVAASGHGIELSMTGPDMTFVFGFDADRVCFTYAIPGEWDSAADSGWYVPKGGRGGVGLWLRSAKDLQ